MNSQKNKLSGIAITFYVVAVIFLVVFAFNFYYCYDSVALQMEQYSVSFSSEWKYFVSIFISQCITSLIGAFVCYGIGAILAKLQNMQNALLVCLETASDDSEDDKEEVIVKATKKATPKVEKTVAENTATDETVVSETTEVKKKKPAAKKKATKKTEDTSELKELEKAEKTEKEESLDELA